MCFSMVRLRSSSCGRRDTAAIRPWVVSCIRLLASALGSMWLPVCWFISLMACNQGQCLSSIQSSRVWFPCSLRAQKPPCLLFHH